MLFKNAPLLFLILISFFTRFLFLDNLPEGFHRDEVAFGYNAYSIAKTARDEFGKFLPLIFESYGDYKLPLVIYTAVPTTLLFGLNDFWVRFPTALFGALTPIFLFFFIGNISKNKTLAYFSAFSLAISPQHILFSRSVNEAVIALSFLLLGLLLVMRLVKKWSSFILFGAGLLLTLSVYTYRTYFIFTPLIIGLFLFLYKETWKRWNKFKKYLSVVAILIFLLSLFYIIGKASNTRIRDIGLQTSGELVQTLAEQIREDGVQNPLITRIFHNKLSGVLILFAKNYFSHFDPTYLFFTGDKLSTNNSTPFMGHLLYIDLPFFLLGAILLIKKRGRLPALAFFWLALGPLSSAATVDSPSALRNLVSTAAYAMIIGFGIMQFLSFRKFRNFKPIVVSLLILLYAANFTYFVHLFTVHKRIHQPWSRDYGVSQMIDSVNKNSSGFDKIIFTDYPDLYMFLLYDEKVDPHILQSLIKDKKFDRRRQELVHLINNKYWIMSEDCLYDGVKEYLYICKGQRISPKSKIIDSIRYTDSLPAFTLVHFPQGYDRIDLEESLPPRYEHIKSGDSGSAVFTPSL